MSPIDGNGMHDRVPTSYVDRVGDEPRREYTKDALRCIGWAVKQMQDGQKVRRAGWNGKGMFIVLMGRLCLPPFSTQGTERKVHDRTAKWIGEDTPLDSQPYIAMKIANGQWQPGWVCSQADLLATDWEIA